MDFDALSDPHGNAAQKIQSSQQFDTSRNVNLIKVEPIPGMVPVVQVVPFYAGTNDALAECSTLSQAYTGLNTALSDFLVSSDATLKAYRFELQRAINIPVNTLTLEDLPQKFTQLRDYIMRPANDFRYPLARLYCVDLLSNAILRQAREQISSNHEFAFVVAKLAKSLCVAGPIEFSEMLLLKFINSCPYFGPLEPMQQEQMSPGDYCLILGYEKRSSAGNVAGDAQLEKSDAFLKRMTGFMLLFSAMLVVEPLRCVSRPAGDSASVWGAGRAWLWLARLLSLRPALNTELVCQLLADFLTCASYTLASTYQRQFIKLLERTVRDLVPSLRARATSGAAGGQSPLLGPVVRLENFLERLIREPTRLREMPSGLAPVLSL